MWRVLILIWALPLVWVPWWGGTWDTYFYPRNTLLAYGVLLTPWWRGRWTPAEWGLVAVALAGVLRQWHLWGIGHAWVWVAGLLLVRSVRGLPGPSQRALRRRWWWGLVPVIAYAGLQVMVPQWDPWPSYQVSSTVGGVAFLAEAILPAVLDSPWPIAVSAGVLLFRLRQRGPWAALLGAAVLFRRWRLVVPLALAALVVLSIRPGLGTMAVRWEVWGRTVAIIRDSSLAGVGTGGYPWAPGLNTIPLQTAPIENVAFAHNEYLERTAEWGIPGGLLFLGWVIARARGSVALTAMALAAVTGFTFVHPLTWAFWCVLAGLGPDKRKDTDHD